MTFYSKETINHLLLGGNMYYIITYDIGIERVNRVKKITRQFLKWEQNSVVTGDLSESKALELERKLRDVINKNEDHIIIFTLRSQKFIERIDLGTPKTEMEKDALFV